MTFEDSLATLFVAVWTIGIVGIAVKELWFTPKFP